MNKRSEKALENFWFYGAVAICALLVAATMLKHLGPQSGPTALLLGRIALTGENNLAAWWSGMLLALLSLHAFDGYAPWRHSDPSAARGWMLIAAVLLFLSFDEVGSLHERLSMLGEALSLGSWTLLFPVGAVLAAMLLRAVVLLWRSEGERPKVTGIVIGFCLLGSVAIQEFLEHRIHWGRAWAVRAAVEEGTELLGMLVLLRIAMGNTARLLTRGVGAAFAALHELRGSLAWFGVVLSPVLAVSTAALPDQHRGHPADWLAAVAFLAAGLIVWQALLSNRSGIGDWPAWVAGGLCCLASAAAVAIGPSWVLHAGPAGLNARMLVLGAIATLVGMAWTAVPARRRKAYTFAAAGGAGLAAVALPSTNLMLIYALSQLLALSFYWVNATIAQESKHDPAVRTASAPF